MQVAYWKIKKKVEHFHFLFLERKLSLSHHQFLKFPQNNLSFRKLRKPSGFWENTTNFQIGFFLVYILVHIQCFIMFLDAHPLQIFLQVF